MSKIKKININDLATSMIGGYTITEIFQVKQQV